MIVRHDDNHRSSTTNYEEETVENAKTSHLQSGIMLENSFLKIQRTKNR